MTFDFIGDTHFTSTHHFNRASFEDFLNWWENSWNPTHERVLIHCGDLYDKNIVDGLTLTYGSRFINAALEKYQDVYILGGNHDLKNAIDFQTYASAYLANTPHVHVVTEPTIMKIADKTLMFLPHIHVPGDIGDYYNSMLGNEFYKTPVDYAVAHVAFNDKFLGGIDPNRFPNVKHWVCGHIHSSSTNPKVYPGSIMPFKIDEGSSYGNNIFTYNDDDKTTNIMPEFRKYVTVDYSKGQTEHLKKRDEKPVTIYKIINAPMNLNARDWPDSFVLTVEKQIQSQQISLLSGNSDSVLLDPWQMFQDMCEKENLNVSRKAWKILQKRLQPHSEPTAQPSPDSSAQVDNSQLTSA